MNPLKGLKVLALLALISLPVPAIVEGDDYRRSACRRGHRIKIVDLDIFPDPILEGQRIRAWKVRIHYKGRHACETEIEVHEGDHVVARTRRVILSRGINEIDFPPVRRYRFHGREHCFNVVVELKRKRRQVDVSRRFCAHKRPSWSMRERDDRKRDHKRDRNYDRFGR